MRHLYLFVLACLSYQCINAQIIAWQFGDPASTGQEATYNATTNHVNLNTSVLSRGAGIQPLEFPLANSFGARRWHGPGKAEAIATDEYFTFSISAATGYQFSLSTLDVKLRRSGTSAPTTYIWQYSTDGTTFTDIGTDIAYTGAGDGDVQPTINLATIPALQNVMSGTTVTFRLYAWGSTNTDGSLSIGRYAAGVTTNSLAIGGTVSPPVVLPVRFSNFKASQKAAAIQLQWTNETEESVVAYTIERSANGRDFTSLATKVPRANNNQKADYTYLDATPIGGDNFYRIKALEYTGKTVYTHIIRINTARKGLDMVIYPNPVKGGELNLQLSNLPAGRYTVKVYNMTGQEVEATSINHAGGHMTESLQLTKRKPGLYALQVNGVVSLNKTFMVE